MKYYVYILFSLEHDRFYIGQTNNLDARFRRHNKGLEKSTSPYVPWLLVWRCEKNNRSQAMLLEKKLKNLSKERIAEFIEKYAES